MAKLNQGRKTIAQQVQNHKDVTVNKAGGLAYKFEDPVEYLIGTIGSAMFVEPKYYQDTENLESLKNGDFNINGLDEQAVKIINACMQIASSDNPRDLLALAHWARKELNMRTTPQVMLAVASKMEGTKQFVRKYVPLVASRADEVKQVVAAYEHLFGWKGFPACLKKGVSDRMASMSEYEILKYNTKDHPSFKDLLRFCERREGYPFSKEIREYILRGEIINSESTPVIAARKQLTSIREWNDEIPELAKRAAVTWEVLISQFGNDKKVWEAVIPLMGYMALLRNLGNFLSAGVSMDTIRAIAEKLSDSERVVNSKQLPFRFLAAYRILDPGQQSNWLYGSKVEGRDRNGWDKRSVNVLMEAVEVALDESILNVPEIPGLTVVAADNSGSMQSPLSKKSAMSIRDAANALCAIIHKRCEESLICAFGSNAVWPPLTKHNSVLTNIEKIATYKEGFRGHSTDAWKVIQYLIDNKIDADRIIVLSDMQCYNSYGHSGVAQLLTQYRREYRDGCYAHFFDLRGYGTKQDAPNKLTNVVAGFSEKIFNQILLFEGIDGVNGSKSIPSIEYIRENY
jgi:60 kDa SS-A/Ro ribonucleoprotein